MDRTVAIPSNRVNLSYRISLKKSKTDGLESQSPLIGSTSPTKRDTNCKMEPSKVAIPSNRVNLSYSKEVFVALLKNRKVAIPSNRVNLSY